MQFSSFIRTTNGLTILFKNTLAISNVDSFKFYNDNSSGLFSKKEFRWSFNNDYWSSWMTLNQGNISSIDVGLNLYVYFEIRYTLSANNSGTVNSFVLNYLEKPTSTFCAKSSTSIIPEIIDNIPTQVSSGCTSIQKISLTNADYLNNKKGDYYLQRSNHKGSQSISTITNLSNILISQDISILNLYNIKLNESSLGSIFFFDVSGFLDVSINLTNIYSYIDNSLNYRDISINNINQHTISLDSSINNINNYQIIQDNSIYNLQNRMNIIDSSIINLKNYIDGSLNSRDVSIFYLDSSKANIFHFQDASTVLLNTTTFNNNFDASINNVQKMANIVDQFFDPIIASLIFG